MALFERVKNKITPIVKHQGHIRIFILVSLAWMAITTPIFLRPYTATPTSSIFDEYTPGDNSPAAVTLATRINNECRTVILGHGDCVANVIARSQFIQIVQRASVFLFVPIILPIIGLLVVIALFWIKEGYDDQQATHQK